MKNRIPPPENRHRIPGMGGAIRDPDVLHKSRGRDPWPSVGSVCTALTGLSGHSLRSVPSRNARSHCHDLTVRGSLLNGGFRISRRLSSRYVKKATALPDGAVRATVSYPVRTTGSCHTSWHCRIHRAACRDAGSFRPLPPGLWRR